MSSRRVLILGGCGRVGRALAGALQADGWELLLTARDEAELEACRDRKPALHACRAVVELSDPEPAQAALEELLEETPVDQVVLSFGQPWSEGELLHATVDELDRLWADQIRSQFVALRQLLPRLAPASTFLMINGSTALAPSPGRGLANLGAAATLMLQRVIAAESDDDQARVVSLLLQGAVDAEDLPSDRVLSGEALAEAVRSLWEIESPAAVYSLRPQQELRRLELSAHEATDLEELA
jgi:NAD(P)-dependent dehydrogenase (short-subunit alcohol dehydrogenase family)